MTALTILDRQIRNKSNFYSLNDLHKAAGNEDRHRPVRFMRLDQTQSLILEIDQRPEMVFTTYRGGTNQGTWVCKELVYAYAMWISAKFHLQVIRAFDALVREQSTMPTIDATIADFPVGTRCLLRVDETGTHLSPIDINGKGLADIKAIRAIQRDAMLLSQALDEMKHRMMALSGEFSLDKLDKPLLQ